MGHESFKGDGSCDELEAAVLEVKMVLSQSMSIH